MKIKTFIKALLVCMVFMAFTVSAAAEVVIDNMDNGELYSARTEKKNIIEGAGAVSQSGSGGTIVMQRNFDETVDISEYKGEGYVRLHFYIESVDKMSDTSGQLELTSSGTCDVEETSWNISKSMLKDGWNTLFFSLESPSENAADLSAINYVRVYIHITGTNKIMLDELIAGTASELGVEESGVVTSSPVKKPDELYGEGGAVAAAMAALGVDNKSGADSQGTDTSGIDENKVDQTDAQNSDNAGSDSASIGVARVVLLAAIPVVAVAAVIAFIAVRSSKKRKSGK